MAFKKIRGPFGEERSDFFNARIAMYAGAPYEKQPDITDFLPWRPPHFSPLGDEVYETDEDEELDEPE
jgi:hypothetical protein